MKKVDCVIPQWSDAVEKL